jgi:SAM-dependent methyltransferase
VPDVLGVDISRNLVEAANGRAKQLGLSNLVVRQGDACTLQGIEAGQFDLVVSIFGAMFAPKPFDVAKEMVRVTRSGGRIVMGNWIPNDPTLVAQILKISSAYTPPPPEGFISPMTWGVEAHVVERFGAAGVPKERIALARDTYTFEYPAPPSELVAAFRNYYGPTGGCRILWGCLDHSAMSQGAPSSARCVPQGCPCSSSRSNRYARDGLSEDSYASWPISRENGSV